MQVSLAERSIEAYPAKAMLECVDSTPAPRAVMAILGEAYGVSGPASCELMQHHLDATYVVSELTKRLFVRVYNARWWTREEIEGEVAVLRHLNLNGHGVKVAAPMWRLDGDWVTSVLAPEGERQLVVYEFLEGEPLDAVADAKQYGATVARMHGALTDCAVRYARRELTFEGLMQDSFDSVIPLLSPSSEQRRYFEDLRARVVARADELDLASFSQGICHGDLNLSNAVRHADGVALFDFECCGNGLLAYDLAVFRWTQQLTRAPERAWLDFVDGYQSERLVPEHELAAIDLLVLMRQAYMLGHDARRSTIESLGTRWRWVGRGPRWDVLRQMDRQLFGTPRSVFR